MMATYLGFFYLCSAQLWTAPQTTGAPAQMYEEQGRTLSCKSGVRGLAQGTKKLQVPVAPRLIAVAQGPAQWGALPSDRSLPGQPPWLLGLTGDPGLFPHQSSTHQSWHSWWLARFAVSS